MIDKAAQIHAAKPGNLAKTWRKYTGSPLGSAAALAAAVGVPTYFLMPWASRRIYSKIAPRLPAQMRQDIGHELATNMPKMQGRLAGTAAGLAAALSLANNWNWRRSGPDNKRQHLWSSLTDWDYAKNENKSQAQ